MKKNVPAKVSTAHSTATTATSHALSITARKTRPMSISMSSFLWKFFSFIFASIQADAHLDTFYLDYSHITLIFPKRIPMHYISGYSLTHTSSFCNSAKVNSDNFLFSLLYQQNFKVPLIKHCSALGFNPVAGGNRGMSP
jgi:hypothetical protein